MYFSNIRVGRTESGSVILEADRNNKHYRWLIPESQWVSFLHTYNNYLITNPMCREELEDLLKQIAQMGGRY